MGGQESQLIEVLVREKFVQSPGWGKEVIRRELRTHIQ